MKKYKMVVLLKENIKKVCPELVKNMQSLSYTLKISWYEHNRVKSDGRIKMVFLVSRLNIWNSVHSVYEAAKRNSMVDTYIVALPPFKNVSIDMETDEVYDFSRKLDKNAIRAYGKDGSLLFDIKNLKPDYIFLNVPYEWEYPEHYKAKELIKSASLCYVPYGYTLIKSDIQKITTSMSIIRYVKYIFTETKITYDAYKDRMKFSEKITGKRLYDEGFPRFDLYSRKNTAEDTTVNTLMWIPRWTAKIDEDEGNEPSSFLKFKDKIIEYAEHETINLIIRPHPLAFKNYIKLGIMTEAEVAEYKAHIARNKKITLDESPSYYEGLMKADVLIADFSSIVAEYFITGKPIIYIGSGEHYPPEHMEMYNSFYHAESWEDIEKILNDLMNGIDNKKKQRQIAVENFLSGKPQNVGEHIVDILINDYDKRK